MLKKKNENLLDADGNLETNFEASTQVATFQEINKSENKMEVIEKEVDQKNVSFNTKQEALENITENNDATNKNETGLIDSEIPMQDYEALSIEELVNELKKLVTNENILQVKNNVEELKKAFLTKFHHLVEEKRKAFYAENLNTTENFEYQSPLKNQFDNYYNLFKEAKNKHFNSLQENLKNNLEKRLLIVEELKNLVKSQDNIKDVLKHFNEIRERWKNAGPIPKDKYNHVWNNYHFHLENFYDYLHLDQKTRDLDFKHNLDQKLKIINRVEALTHEENIEKAFRELQDLHRIWKENIGPVAREYREQIWNKFSELTKQIHDKRDQMFDNLRELETKNLQTKKTIVQEIEKLASEKVEEHSQWLLQIDKVEALRETFFNTGKVPIDENEKIWNEFKNAVRNFNAFKNTFYKEIKKNQNQNLNEKIALIEKAKTLKDSEDFEATTPIMKQIQEDWKKIGHVPRKYSDTIWKDFKDACNYYFEKLKEHKNQENETEIVAFDNKKEYLETMRSFEMIGDYKADLENIKKHIETWKSFGNVPFTRRHIEGKFNKILDSLFEKLSLNKKDTEMLRFSNRVNSLSENNDTRKLDSEEIFLIRKIEEIKNEILQLENNIQFFTNTKNAKKENSIVLEVRKNIAIQKESLEIWKEKLKQLKNIKHDTQKM